MKAPCRTVTLTLILLRAEVAALRDELRLLRVELAEEVRTRQVIVEYDFARVSSGRAPSTSDATTSSADAPG
jgi:hypothetical protein